MSETNAGPPDRTPEDRAREITNRDKQCHHLIEHGRGVDGNPYLDCDECTTELIAQAITEAEARGREQAAQIADNLTRDWYPYVGAVIATAIREQGA